MAAKTQLNLVGMVSPFCLLAFKAAMARLNPQQVLEVRVRDPEVMADLVRLVHHSPDRLINREEEGDCFCIRVERGEREGAAGPPADRPGPAHEQT